MTVFLILGYDNWDKEYNNITAFSNKLAAEKYKEVHNEKMYGDFDSIKIVEVNVLDDYIGVGK